MSFFCPYRCKKPYSKIRAGIIFLLFVYLCVPVFAGDQKNKSINGNKSTTIYLQPLETPAPMPCQTEGVETEKPSKESRKLQGDINDALKSMKLEKSSIDMVVCGKQVLLPVYIQQKYNDIYLQLNDKTVLEIFENLGARLSLDPEKKLIKSTLLNVGDKIVSVKIDEATIEEDNDATKLSPPPFICRNEIFICLKHLPALTSSVLSKDKKTDRYYLDPVLNDIKIIQGKKRIILSLRASSKFETECFILKGPPRRYVIDLVHLHLSDKLLHAPRKEIFHDKIGKIEYSQNSINPDRVRIVIPLPEGLDISRFISDSASEACFSLVMKNPSQVGINFSLQKVTSVNVIPMGSEMLLQLGVTGPVEYEWHRFKSPDDRFFLDIHNTVLAGKKKDLKPTSPLVEEIRIAQFQNKPTQIVRVVIELKKNYLCRIIKSKPGSGKFGIRISKQLDTSNEDSSDGNGATSFPKPGKKIICIDPGHGGMDSGALNYALKLQEKKITLDISRRLSRILIKDGWNVILTRTTDRDVSYYGSSDLEELGARVKVASDMKASIFISIHCDASANHSVNGVSTHWYKEIDSSLATAVHDKLIANSAGRDRKTHKSRFYVLSNTSMPSILVETAFISNSQDACKLNSSSYREKIAKAMAEGINYYFRLHNRSLNR